jgi:hypothetical protein
MSVLAPPRHSNEVPTYLGELGIDSLPSRATRRQFSHRDRHQHGIFGVGAQRHNSFPSTSILLIQFLGRDRHAQRHESFSSKHGVLGRQRAPRPALQSLSQLHTFYFSGGSRGVIDRPSVRVSFQSTHGVASSPPAEECDVSLDLKRYSVIHFSHSVDKAAISARATQTDLQRVPSVTISNDSFVSLAVEQTLQRVTKQTVLARTTKTDLRRVLSVDLVCFACTPAIFHATTWSSSYGPNSSEPSRHGTLKRMEPSH